MSQNSVSNATAAAAPQAGAAPPMAQLSTSSQPALQPRRSSTAPSTSMVSTSPTGKQVT